MGIQYDSAKEAVMSETIRFSVEKQKSEEIKLVLNKVNNALKEKGYQPVNQMVGYLISGDPTYITSQDDARNLIRSIERDEILEELLKHYLDL